MTGEDGQVIDGRYRLTRQLGAGSYGAVYAADRLERPGEGVAIKIVDNPAVGSSELQARFLREVKNARRLEHPNAVRVLEHGRLPDDRLYYVMELLEGYTLRQLRDACGRLTPGRAVAITLQVLEVLAAAHALDMVHRDVKAENVVLVEGAGGAETAKLLDFGFAKILGDSSTQNLTRDDRIFGTVPYMAPELLQGLPIDGRADLYAAGVLLFELLTGRRPFEGPTVRDIMHGHLMKPVPSAAAAAGVPLPERLDEVITRALAKKASERFQSAQAMADALRVATPFAAELRVPFRPLEVQVEAAPTRCEGPATPPIAATPTVSDAPLSALGGRYRLGKVVHRARGARVHRAWDLEADRAACVRIADAPAAALPAEQRSGWARAAQALASVRHPHAAELIDHGADAEGAPYLVTAWFPGGPLARRLERGPMEAPVAAGVVCQLLEALESLHRAGFIHRAVSTAHVLVAESEEGGPYAQLVGFAAAAPLEGGPEATRWSPPRGGSRFMSPEQVRGAGLDPRADIFAAGVVLLEAVTGDAYHPGTWDERCPAVSPALAEALERSLAPEPSDRFPTARAMRRALCALAGPFAVPLPPIR